MEDFEDFGGAKACLADRSTELSPEPTRTDKGEEDYRLLVPRVSPAPRVTPPFESSASSSWAPSAASAASSETLASVTLRGNPLSCGGRVGVGPPAQPRRRPLSRLGSGLVKVLVISLKPLATTTTICISSIRRVGQASVSQGGVPSIGVFWACGTVSDIHSIRSRQEKAFQVPKYIW